MEEVTVSDGYLYNPSWAYSDGKHKRAGITKNKGQKRSKARSHMAKISRQRNRA